MSALTFSMAGHAMDDGDGDPIMEIYVMIKNNGHLARCAYGSHGVNVSHNTYKFELEIRYMCSSMSWAARTQAPTATNYDVGSTTWADLRRMLLPSAIKAINLGHGPP
ncbi:hypothetical protein Q3G72_015550 [Acer saccharum]|nr:hypothetical protein Q3G72_015550 [Acer saccharum]